MRDENGYSHLDEQARALVDAPAEVRIQNIQQTRFIEHGAARRIRELAESMMSGPRSIRPRCLMVIADAGAGKTSVLRHLQRRHPDQQSRSPRRLIRPVVYTVVDPIPELEGVQRSLMTALGAPNLDLRSAQRNDLIIRSLTEFDTRMVFFDEVQHLLHLTPRWQRVAMDWLKWISTTARVNVVATGVRGAELLLRLDPQLASRFQIGEVPVWTAGAAFGAFLHAFVESLPLRRPSMAWDLKAQRTLIDESRMLHTLPGVTDGVLMVLKEAATAAIACGAERITDEFLAAWREKGDLPRRTMQVDAPIGPALIEPLEPAADQQLHLQFEAKPRRH